MTENDVFTDMFLKAVRSLNVQPEALEAAYKEYPFGAKEMEKTLDALDRVWRQAVAGQATEQDFRAVLIDWYRVRKKAADVGADLKRKACHQQETLL